MSTDQPRNNLLSVKARAFSVSSLIGSCNSPHRKSNRIPDNDLVKGAFHSQSNQQPTSSEDRTTQVAVSSSNQSIKAELLCRELWLEFHSLGTEMIITKAGR